MEWQKGIGLFAGEKIFDKNKEKNKSQRTMSKGSHILNVIYLLFPYGQGQIVTPSQSAHF